MGKKGKRYAIAYAKSPYRIGIGGGMGEGDEGNGVKDLIL
jgi:hypothetical protein